MNLNFLILLTQFLTCGTYPALYLRLNYPLINKVLSKSVSLINNRFIHIKTAPTGGLLYTVIISPQTVTFCSQQCFAIKTFTHSVVSLTHSHTPVYV